MNIEEILQLKEEPVGEEDKKCAPSKIFENGSCIPLDDLIEMANAYNAENENNKIILYSQLNLNPKQFKLYLLKQFKKRFANVCDNQKCWIEQRFMKNINKQTKQELNKFTWRPEGPDKPDGWLNTLQINDVMAQYEKKYIDYKFLGAVPIDFEDLNLEISKINFENLINKEKKTKIGVVYNLDPHDKPGSHWCALYADLKAGQILFSDSYGVRPHKNIRKFMRTIARFCQNNLAIRDIVVDFNKERAQFLGSECGVYGVSFILRMLKGESFEEINKSKISDAKINKCRRVYFK